MTPLIFVFVSMLNLLSLRETAFASGSILYIDLNNRDMEVSKCEEGLKEAYASQVQPEWNCDDSANMQSRCIQPKVFRLNAEKAKAYSTEQCPWQGEIKECHVSTYMQQIRRHRYKLDTIALSGDDGNGQFFGVGGTLTVQDIQMALNKNPSTRQGITTMLHNGCYAATVQACNKTWMRKVAPNVQTTMGFLLQAPYGTEPENYNLMKELCGKRDQINAAATEQELDSAFKGLAGVDKVSASICIDRPELKGVCSMEYAKGGTTPASCYQSYDELYRRCQTELPSEDKYNMYMGFLNADSAEFANPPAKGRADACSVNVGKSCLRQYYDEVQKWRHCAGLYQERAGHPLPSPGQMMRLIFFNEIKSRVANNHAGELAAYNKLLDYYNLSAYRLDNLQSLSRAVINQRLIAVRRAVRKLPKNQATVNGVKIGWMAQELDRTLRELESKCVPGAWVNADSEKRSSCLNWAGGRAK